jgi:hypothetical protein
LKCRPHLSSRYKFGEGIHIRRNDSGYELAVIRDLNCFTTCDLTQDLTALVSHLPMGDRPHVAQRSTPLEPNSRTYQALTLPRRLTANRMAKAAPSWTKARIIACS